MFSPTSGCLVHRTFGLFVLSLSVGAWSVVSTGAASAQTLKDLASFAGTDGENPSAGLVADGAGNLYGTTVTGGSADWGVVFKVPLVSAGTYAASPTVLYSFDNDLYGSQPSGGLIEDSKGDLFGTAKTSGADYQGTVFEIPANSPAGTVPNLVATFDVTHGSQPVAGLFADAKGNLIGTTFSGGANGSGAVFELLYDANTGSYGFSSSNLVDFGSEGRRPTAGLVADANGNLFGTTQYGGMSNYGTAFEVPYDASTGTYGAAITLASFNGGTDPAYPIGGLIVDKAGNLFGTTFLGGAHGKGTVYEIPFDGTAYGAAKILVSLDGTAGSKPEASLIMDANGNLFGTASDGGQSAWGTVFEVPFNATNGTYASTAQLVWSFSGSDGARPSASLIADGLGNLFGTTYIGGDYSAGTVFELTGSGFVPPVHFAGTPGTANCAGQSVSTLTHTYGGISHAASSLGYASVAALQSAVSGYCAQE